MKLPLPALLLALGLSGGAAAPAAAYPIDCAILLCLAGGFPPSEPCLRAKVEVMRRITGIPFQPPLQIWNCPMQVLGVRAHSRAVVLDAGFPIDLNLSRDLHLAQLGGVPSIPVEAEGSSYGFLETLRVIRVTYSQRPGKENSCTRTAQVSIGQYADEDEFVWVPGRTSDIPSGSEFRPAGGCGLYMYRSIMLSWRDVAGTSNLEEVRY